MFEANFYQDPVTTEMLQFVVDGAGSDQLLHHLPAVGQLDPESSTKPSGDDPRGFYWIFKNMDFERWQSAKGLQVLWISGPAECCISGASSRIVDQAMKTSSESGEQHSMLYFFCSTAPTIVPIAITFISTIIHQLLRSLPGLKEKVTTVFLRTLLDTILRDEPLLDQHEELSRFNRDDSVEATVKKILQASSDGYWGALRAVVKCIDCEHRVSLIIDGLDNAEHLGDEFIQKVLRFIDFLRGRPTTTRVLLTSRPQAGIKDVLSGVPSIEYDRERRGLISIACLFMR